MTQKETIQTSQNRVQTLSTIVARASLAKGLGLSYGGDRDLYQALGYETSLTYDDYKRQYDRQDIAKALIDRPAEATWKGELRVMESKQTEQTSFEKKWAELETSFSLKTKFIRLDKLTCLGEYSILLFGFGDAKTIEDFKKPVAVPSKLLYIRPIGQSQCKINTWEENTKNVRYGQPLTYQITLTEANQSTKSYTVIVHYTRVLHVVKDQLESEIIGVPTLQAVFNRLKDLEKLVGGSAEMFWRGARPGYHGDIDKDFQMTAAIEEDLKDQIDEYENNLRRIITTQGLTMKDLAMQISDPKNHVDVQIQMISSITGIPKRILTGSERGELSSSQDEDTWLTLIQARREDFAEPKIVRPFIKVCLEHGILPKPKNEDWIVLWSDLFAKSEKDQAEVGRIRATALREYTLNPYAVEVCPPPAFFEYFLGLTQHQINLISEMREEGIGQESIAQETPEETAIRKEKEKQARSQINPIRRTENV